MKKHIALILFFLIISFYLSGQVFFSYIPGEKYRVVERSDYRIRVNGIYRGHVYNENRGILSAVPEQNGSYTVQGKFYIFEELTKDGFRRSSKIDNESESFFSQYTSGEMIIGRDVTYPLMRSFPNYGSEARYPGDRWQAYSEKVVLQNGTKTVFPVYVDYVYEGPGTYKGLDIHEINAKFAVRYNLGDDLSGNGELKNISGTHDVSIIIEADTGRPVLIRDNMREIHTFTNGGTLEKNGFTLTFFEGVRGLDQGTLAERIRGDLEENLPDAISKSITLSEGKEGLSLSLDNLNFLPDQAVLLDEDRALLDVIASVLRSIDERTFYVKGHTARIGSVESQLDLSLERAKVVVQEMVNRGISEERFIFRGVGGEEPLESNETEEGRAANRRVEIIIMED